MPAMNVGGAAPAAPARTTPARTTAKGVARTRTPRGRHVALDGRAGGAPDDAGADDVDVTVGDKLKHRQPVYGRQRVHVDAYVINFDTL